MKCDICDMPAVINDLCQGCYDDLAKGGDDALRAAEMFQLRIAELKTQLADGRTYAEGCKP